MCWLVIEIVLALSVGAALLRIFTRLFVWLLLHLVNIRVCLDFGEHHRVLPNHYTIGYYVNGDDHIPCR